MEAEQRAPARDCKAALAAWAAESARQWATRAAALPVEVPQPAADRKLLTTFTEGAQAEVQVWAAVLLLKAPKGPAEVVRRVLREAEALQQPGQPEQPAQRQPEAQARPSKDVSPRKRNSGFPGSRSRKKD